MNKLDSVISKVLESVRNNPRTLLIVNDGGQLVDFIPLQELPDTPEQLSSLIRSRIKGSYAVGIIHQDKSITEEAIRKKISDCVESLTYSKTHELNPGVNIPEKNTKGLRKIWWKLKLFYHLSKIKIEDYFKRG